MAETGGTLTITTKSIMISDKYKGIEISIEDTGCGIRSEYLSRIFEPFFTTKQQGTGLGLAIVQKIITAHSGNITVESELNKGTKVNICLPVEASSSSITPKCS
jgi:signal transduction histidine kinase